MEHYRLAFPDLPDPPESHVSYGEPFAVACKKHVVDTFKCEKAYIIASTTLSKTTDHLRHLTDELDAKLAGTWIGIEAHTPLNGLLPIIRDVREKEADCIITLGGGSLCDGAKIIVFALANNASSLEEIESLNMQADGPKSKEATMPVICIPTSLSGAEYSGFAGGTVVETGEKKMFTNPSMYPKLVILDPELTLSNPLRSWLSTGVRAIDHCVESICSTNAQAMIDAASEKALKLLLPSLLATKSNPLDCDARLKSQLGANLAMEALACGVLKGASHGIGHQLGPLGVPHGETSCILLPAVMKYNAASNRKQQEKVKKIMWDEPAVHELLVAAGLRKESSDVGDALVHFFQALQLPTTLLEVGIGREKFDQLARNSLNDEFCKANPVPLTERGQVFQILEMALGE